MAKSSSNQEVNAEGTNNAATLSERKSNPKTTTEASNAKERNLN